MAFTAKKTETKPAGKPPVAKIRDGLISASIWEQASEKGSFYSVTFERRYKDAEGNWKSSHSYDSRDLLQLAKLADLAHTRILEETQGQADSPDTGE